MANWHVCDLAMKRSYGVYDYPVDAIKEALRLLRLVHPDALGPELYFKQVDKTWGTFYWQEKPFLNIIQMQPESTQQLISARFNPQASHWHSTG